MPKPTDNLIRATKKRITWADLEEPSTSDLKKKFLRLLNIVVSRDTLSTRRDDQLNNLCNIILAKLEGDKITKYSPEDPAPFQVWDTESDTAIKIKELFLGMRIAHSDLFLTDSDKDINAECCDSIKNKDFNRREIFYCKTSKIVRKKVYVPKYFDNETFVGVQKLVKENKGLKLRTLGTLKIENQILMFGGHGSLSPDQRIGEIPYIKVSDLRAGHVNINPTNMVPISLAREYWRSDESNLLAYDLLSPERASKNIGEFCILMPGQESAVLTKEIIIVRANTELFDQFFCCGHLRLKKLLANGKELYLCRQIVKMLAKE